MKQMIKIIMILGVLAILYQFFIMFFVNKRTSNYSVLTSDNSYMIKEDYKRKGSTNMYSFLITDHDKNNFVYSYEGDLNRQSKIIKDIVNYKEGNLNCIAPVFNNNTIENVVCKYNDELVSYTYLKQISNNNIDNFITKLSSSKYNVNLDFRNINSVKTDYDKISYYEGIDSNLYFTIWNYDGLYIVNNNKIEDKKILEKDCYENEYGILVDKFYVLVNTDVGTNSFYVVNIKDGGKAKIEAEDNISINIYFNGIYNKKVYFTDLDNRQQFVLDPSREKITKLDEAKYYDGTKLKDIDISELVMNKKYFMKDSIPDEIINKYGSDTFYSNQNYYYEKDGSVYEIVGNNYEYKVKLFSFDSFKELKVLNGNVYGINNDTVYMYNNKIGLKKIIDNRELIYNYRNIFDVYQK